MSWVAVLAWGLAAASVIGMIYQALASWLVVSFMNRPRPIPGAVPPVSVLKPLCGAEPGLAANLERLFALSSDRFQVVAGVASPADPAAELARRVGGGRDGVSLVVDPRRHGPNLKVGNLINMVAAARHDVLLIEDSDVATSPETIEDMVAPLADPRVGIVTALYVGHPAGDLASRLCALGVNHGFLPSALVARALGRKDGCFGAAMALRRGTLEAAGGFGPLAQMLADDWVLGQRVRALGLDIALAARPVAMSVNEAGLSSLLAHEIRWGRTIASIDRAGYLGSILTQPVVLGALAALFGGASFLPVLALSLLVRLGAMRVQEHALGLSRAPFALLVLRDTLSAVVFVAAAVGRSVSWRGKRFRLRPDGTMELVEGLS